MVEATIRMVDPNVSYNIGVALNHPSQSHERALTHDVPSAGPV
jgi:hypothetical protein